MFRFVHTYRQDDLPKQIYILSRLGVALGLDFGGKHERIVGYIDRLGGEGFRGLPHLRCMSRISLFLQLLTNCASLQGYGQAVEVELQVTLL
jgi:hypothetical protein